MAESIEKRIEHLRERITALDYICSGTLLQRTKVCGKPTCRCAHDPTARHGPYYEWSRREQGRLVHSVLSSAQARRFVRAIRNYRRIQRLLEQWERESVRAIRAEIEEKP